MSTNVHSQKLSTYHHAEFFNDEHHLDTDAHATEYERFSEICQQVIEWCAL